MKVGMILLCRYDSKRLPGKILKKIKGKRIIEYIIDRLNGVGNGYPIYVATSNEKSDDPIINFCKNKSIPFFRGSKSNVASRFLECSLKMNIDYAIRINGDNLFTDSNIILDMIKLTKTEKWSFLSNIYDRTFPMGVSVEIVNVELLKNKISLFDQYEREHVMPYFYKNLDESQVYKYKNENYSDDFKIKLAIDDKNDFEFASKIIDSMDYSPQSYSISEIVELIATNSITA